MSNELEIRINGNLFYDWNELSISKDMESLSGSFEFNLVQIEENVWPISNGDKIEIHMGKNNIINGYIEYIGPDLYADDRAIQVVGRDNTCDLIDCTYPGKKTEFTGKQTILDIASELCSSFGISVVSELKSIPTLSNFKIDPGEKVYEALERASRRAGVLFQPSGDGKLVLTQVASEFSGLRFEEGYGLLDAYAVYNDTERFSEYLVKAQDKNNKNVTAKAIDEGISRFRPLELIADSVMTKDEAQKKVDWELAVRVARSLEVSATIQGWSSSANPILPNIIVEIDSPKIRVFSEKLLVKSVDYMFDDDGTTANLTLTRPDAYIPEPVKKKRPEKDSLNALVREHGYR